MPTTVKNTDLALPPPARTVFPVGPDKRPLCRWGSIPIGHADPGPGPAYGVRTGEGFFVLDVDVKGGADGFRSIEDLGVELPRTFTVDTPSGGRHYYYLGDAPTRAGVAPGVDVRGRGGYVVGPGSRIESGEYTVFDDSPMVEPSATLAALIHAPARTFAPAPSKPAGAITVAHLRAACQGKRGPYWAAIRRAVDGDRICRAMGGDVGPDVGPVDDFLTRMFARLAREFPDHTGDEIVGLIWPSLSLLIADDEELGNPVYSRADFARKFDSAAEKVRSARNANALLEAAVEKATEAGPVVLVHRSSFYVRDQTGTDYYGPYVQAELSTQLGSHGYVIHRPTEKGGKTRMSTNQILDAYAENGGVDEVVYTYDETSWDPSSRVLRLCRAPRADLEPRHDPTIDEWLRLLGGDPLLDWIRVIFDAREAVPAVWITGSARVGKNLLVRGVASLWRHDTPIPLARAMERFNDSITRTPVVFGDETVPSNFRGEPRVEELKSMITDTLRTVEIKHGSVSPLVGGLRVILASNNMNMLRSARAFTREDTHALVDRLIHLDIGPDRAREIRKIFDAAPVQERWIDRKHLARHLLWIVANRDAPPRGERLRVSAYGPTTREVVASAPASSFYVLRAIAQWLDKAAESPEYATQIRGIFVREGAVHATAAAIRTLLDRGPGQRDAPSDRAISTALRAVSSKRVRVRDRRYWRVDTRTLLVWAEDHDWAEPERLVEAMEKLQ